MEFQEEFLYINLRSNRGVGVPLVIHSIYQILATTSTMGFSNQWICLALILTLGALASQATVRTLQDALMRERHEDWMTHHGCVYKDTAEKENRFKIFKENVARIEFLNNAANKPYKLSVNQFADLTNEEFKASRNRFMGHKCSTKTTNFRYDNVIALPSSVDWKKKGAVTPIKDQGQCGKCLILILIN
jgi:KDEL-tailed cysteine endopeptidase